MATSVTRRAFLVGLGAGVASAGAAWSLWQVRPWSRASADRYPLPEGYVDYAGWMLTKTDKDKLTASGSIKRLEASMFDGHDIADRVVADADACSAWCLEEPDCQGFSYAKPSHPNPEFQNRC